MLDTSLDSVHFYFLVAVLQGVVLSVLIITRRPVKWTNISFGLIVFLFSLSLLHGVLEQSIHAFNVRFLFPMEYAFMLGPLSYFHFRQIANPARARQWKDGIHFIPSLLFDFVFYLVAFSYLAAHLEWAEANVQQIQFAFLIIALLFVAHIAIYAFFSYKQISLADIRPKENIADIRKWTKVFFVLWSVVIVVQAVVIFGAIFNLELFNDSDYLLYNPMGIIKAICIYSLGYLYLIKYLPILARQSKHFERAMIAKYPANELRQKQEQLHTALERGELYKDEKLTVEKLAKHLGWSARDVSGIIGERFDLNFNDFINTYRVKAFKAMAEQPENKKYSIMGLAEKAGFNSKASFYRAFKRECGQTPSEFFASKNP